jgi:hypothetical protein
MNKTKIRGAVYALISLCGLSYELMFIQPPRIFLLLLYSLIVAIGLLYIFRFPDQ